jgi:hypothetical protein
MTLEKGDRVTTGPGATAVIRWPSGSVAHLHPNSRARIGSLFELVGEVFVRVRGRFVLETEFVIVGAEGTSYLVRAVPSGEAEVLVLDGRVTVSSLLRAWAPVGLARGEKTVTEDRAPARLPNGKPPPPSPSVRPPVKMLARPDELRETQVVSTRIAKIAETSAAARRAEPKRVTPDARRVTPELDPRRTIPGEDPRRVTPDPRRVTPTDPDPRRVAPDLDPRRATPDLDPRRSTPDRIPRRGTSDDDSRDIDAAPAFGWCCIRGLVSRTNAANCSGSGGAFYTNEAAAWSSCRAPR